MKVLKFGGTSVGSAESIKNVIEIVCKGMKKDENKYVVVSAFSGVTNQLHSIGLLASESDESYSVKLRELEQRHLFAVEELISVRNRSAVLANVKSRINELEDVSKGVYYVQELSPKVQDLILSFGERLSAYIITEAIKDRGIKCGYLDARILVKTDESYGNAKPDFEQTYKNIGKFNKSNKGLFIVTGFIGSAKNGNTTTLGRQGSDFSASIFGAGLKSSVIEIWTDVDGVLTADPKEIKRAFVIDHLTYEEAMELSYFGAKVIYPPTMQPASEKNIPIHIKNTFNPEAQGTVISNNHHVNGHIIKGISSIRNISILRVQGSGMIGVAGVSKRLFGALAKKSVNVILITQASSEHSICVAIDEKNSQIAKEAIEEEFSLEIVTHRMENVIVENELSIIAIVGENMRHRHGMAGRLFQAMGKNGINLVAIAQGSSELNISAVISRNDESKALNVIHDAFFLSETKSLNVFLLGTGLIGSTLLKQVMQQLDSLRKEKLLDLRFVAMANINRMLFDLNGIPLDSWKEILESFGLKMNINKFVDSMKNANLSNSVFIDCTASDEVVKRYIEILSSNISIITPNKKANSADYGFYKKLREVASAHNVNFLYETNVGAGLPIINTLSDLLSTGDKIMKIEAILSGTLSYIFNSFDGSKVFSEVVKEAKERGYTEPDPRDDLNGRDVARKILILAREIGIPLELKDIKVENLLSNECLKAKDINDFFNKLKKSDKTYAHRINECKKNYRVLRYIATLENGKAKISLESVGRSHPFFMLSGSDNIISFTTTRYKETPLVVKGPGAGAEVTAAGVFSDMLRISNYLM